MRRARFVFIAILCGFFATALPAGPGGGTLTKVEEPAPRSSGTVSDYLPFAQAGVPYVAWDGPRHADYHQTGDAAGKIDFEGMAKIVRLAYLTLASLADR